MSEVKRPAAVCVQERDAVAVGVPADVDKHAVVHFLEQGVDSRDLPYLISRGSEDFKRAFQHVEWVNNSVPRVYAVDIAP
jgi:hypothetical protein